MENQLPVRFDSRKTMRRFADAIEDMEKGKRAKVVQAVKDLYEKKVLSEEGEYDCFNITESDLRAICRA